MEFIGDAILFFLPFIQVTIVATFCLWCILKTSGKKWSYKAIVTFGFVVFCISLFVGYLMQQQKKLELREKLEKRLKLLVHLDKNVQKLYINYCVQEYFVGVSAGATTVTTLIDLEQIKLPYIYREPTEKDKEQYKKIKEKVLKKFTKKEIHQVMLGTSKLDKDKIDLIKKAMKKYNQIAAKLLKNYLSY